MLGTIKEIYRTTDNIIFENRKEAWVSRKP